MKIVNTVKTIENLKRLSTATITCQQAILNFGKASQLIRDSMPTVDDWRKLTLRK